jgi:mono/diheme cytochrome c family protein
MDVMVKDSKRYNASNGWGFFNFTHEAPPYAKSAKALPAENCASCHEANATKDMVFTKFYPILNDR